jgi:hypothetical protein
MKEMKGGVCESVVQAANQIATHSFVDTCLFWMIDSFGSPLYHLTLLIEVSQHDTTSCHKFASMNSALILLSFQNGEEGKWWLVVVESVLSSLLQLLAVQFGTLGSWFSKF